MGRPFGRRHAHSIRSARILQGRLLYDGMSMTDGPAVGQAKLTTLHRSMVFRVLLLLPEARHAPVGGARAPPFLLVLDTQGVIGSLLCCAWLAQENQALGSLAEHMQGLNVWLTASVWPGSRRN